MGRTGRTAPPSAKVKVLGVVVYLLLCTAAIMLVHACTAGQVGRSLESTRAVVDVAEVVANGGLTGEQAVLAKVILEGVNSGVQGMQSRLDDLSIPEDQVLGWQDWLVMLGILGGKDAAQGGVSKLMKHKRDAKGSA